MELISFRCHLGVLNINEEYKEIHSELWETVQLLHEESDF